MTLVGTLVVGVVQHHGVRTSLMLFENTYFVDFLHYMFSAKLDE